MWPAMSYVPSPPPPLSRASLVIGLYAAMGIVAFLIAAGRGDPDLYRLGGSPTLALLAAGPLIGAALGLAVVGLTRLATKHFQWARDLHASFRDLLPGRIGRGLRPVGHQLVAARGGILGEPGDERSRRRPVGWPPPAGARSSGSRARSPGSG